MKEVQQVHQEKEHFRQRVQQGSKNTERHTGVAEAQRESEDQEEDETSKINRNKMVEGLGSRIGGAWILAGGR